MIGVSYIVAKIEKKKKKIQTSGRLKLVPLKLFEHANVTVHALTRLLNFSVNSDVRFRLFISRRSWRVRHGLFNKDNYLNDVLTRGN